MDEFTPERFLNIQLHTYGPRVLLEPYIQRAYQIEVQAKLHCALQEFNYERHLLLFSQIRLLPSFQSAQMQFEYYVNVQSGYAVYNLPYYRQRALAVKTQDLISNTRNSILDYLYEDYALHCKQLLQNSEFADVRREEFEHKPLAPSYYFDMQRFLDSFYDPNAPQTRAADKLCMKAPNLDITLSYTAEERHQARLTQSQQSSYAAYKCEYQLVENALVDVLRYLDKHFGKRKIAKSEVLAAIKKQSAAKAVELVPQRHADVFKIVGDWIVCDWLHWKHDFAK